MLQDTVQMAQNVPAVTQPNPTLCPVMRNASPGELGPFNIHHRQNIRALACVRPGFPETMPMLTRIARGWPFYPDPHPPSCVYTDLLTSIHLRIISHFQRHAVSESPSPNILIYVCIFLEAAYSSYVCTRRLPDRVQMHHVDPQQDLR